MDQYRWASNNMPWTKVPGNPPEPFGPRDPSDESRSGQCVLSTGEPWGGQTTLKVYVRWFDTQIEAKGVKVTLQEVGKRPILEKYAEPYTHIVTFDKEVKPGVEYIIQATSTRQDPRYIRGRLGAQAGFGYDRVTLPSSGGTIRAVALRIVKNTTASLTVSLFWRQNGNPTDNASVWLVGPLGVARQNDTYSGNSLTWHNLDPGVWAVRAQARQPGDGLSWSPTEKTSLYLSAGQDGSARLNVDMGTRKRAEYAKGSINVPLIYSHQPPNEFFTDVVINHNVDPSWNYKREVSDRFAANEVSVQAQTEAMVRVEMARQMQAIRDKYPDPYEVQFVEAKPDFHWHLKERSEVKDTQEHDTPRGSITIVETQYTQVLRGMATGHCTYTVYWTTK